MAKTKKKSTTQKLIDRYGAQAVAEAFLRFNPERSSLRAALQDVAQQEKHGVSSAKSVFASVKGATAQARPELQKIYDGSGAVAKQLRDAATSPANGPGGAAASIESALADRRAEDAKARSLAETLSRDQEAASGMAFQVGNVKGRAAQDREKIRTRSLEIDREEGAFTQGRVGSLADAARKRAATLRAERLRQAGQDRRQEDQQDFTSGEKAKDRAAADRRAGARDKNGTKKPPEAYVDTRDSVNAALRHAKALKNGGVGRNQALDTLVTGRESQTIPSGKTRVNPATGKPVETTVKLPAIPKTKRTFAQIAVELAWTGKISAQSARRLRALGYSVKTLGYHVQSSKPKRGGFADPGIYKTS